MREAPRLSQNRLRTKLEGEYGLTIRALTFLPIGNDADSFVYRVDAVDGQCYFLKLRTNQRFSAPSLLIPRFLHEKGIPHIIAPLPTQRRDLWLGVDDFILTLYPFVDARTATAAGLSDAEWMALGAVLRHIHESPIPADLQRIIPREQFVPMRRPLLVEIEAQIARPDHADVVRRELIDFWHDRQHEIRRIIQRADRLADQLRQNSPAVVLCHADIHTWNVLIDAERKMWIVDWDEIIYAPKERDLMFVIGGIARGLVSDQSANYFLQGYGPTQIDPRALTYYRYAWAVQEIAAYAEDVFLATHLSESSRRSSLDAFIDIFAPGNIAAIATASDDP